MKKNSSYKDFLVGRFWSHVDRRPFEAACYVKNQGGPGVSVAHSSHNLNLPDKEYRPVTWAQSGFLVATVMDKLTEAGVQPGSRVAINMASSVQWIWIDLAIQSLNAISVSIPAYFNSAQVDAAIAECGAQLLIFDDNSANDRRRAHAVKVLPVSHFLSVRPYCTDAGFEFFRERRRVSRIDGVLEAIFDLLESPFESASAPATIFYDLDATGRLDNTVITHGQIAASCRALVNCGVGLEDDQIYQCNLPLSNVFERINGAYLSIWNGWTSIYGDGSRRRLLADTGAMKPSFMMGTARDWEALYGSLKDRFGLPGSLLGSILEKSNGNKLVNRLNKLIHSVVCGYELGGNLRTGFVVGPPLKNAEVLLFYRNAGIRLFNVFGTVDTGGALALQFSDCRDQSKIFCLHRLAFGGARSDQCCSIGLKAGGVMRWGASGPERKNWKRDLLKDTLEQFSV